MTTLNAPLRLRSGLVLPNRIAKSAMTEALGDSARLPSPDLLRLYERWSVSGAGTLITGNVGIDADHPVRARDVILNRYVPVEAFARWAKVAKSGGAALVMQLNHGGRQTPQAINPHPLGPSSGAAVKIMHAFGKPRAASEEEIREIVRRFGEAAALAEQAGFDGVQVHAAHGYLLNQFLSPDVNAREDAWGGTLSKRARLLLECVRAARAATSKSFSIFVKLNAADFYVGGFTEDESLEVVSLLDAEAIDLLEISGGRYESGASFGHASPNAGAREAYFLGFSRRAREATSAAIMLTGGLRSRAAMASALQENALDVVGIARPMALVPDYPKRLLESVALPAIATRRTGLAALDGAAELAWYAEQLARMGRGDEPDPELSPWRALVAYTLTDLYEGYRQRCSRFGSRKARKTLQAASSVSDV